MAISPENAEILSNLSQEARNAYTSLRDVDAVSELKIPAEYEEALNAAKEAGLTEAEILEAKRQGLSY